MPVSRDGNAEKTAGISDAQLRDAPFFGPFEDMSVCGANGSEVARARHAYYMSTCIPAESYATGANPLPTLRHVDNVDMARYKSKQRVPSFWNWKRSWNHGYYINAPLIRTFDFYRELPNRTKSTREANQ